MIIQQTPQEKQQLYLEKVNQFFGQVKKWLPNSFKTVQIENHLLEDKTGEYKTPLLSIIKKEGGRRDYREFDPRRY